MTTPPLPPGSVIGIVGGGQLGRMSAMAAARLGYRCHILTPDAAAPAIEVAADATVGAYDDPQALAAFAASADVITFEFENVSAAGLAQLAGAKPVRPGVGLLRLSQDRTAEKSFVNAAGIATTPWIPLIDRGDIAVAAAVLGWPAVLKTTRLGYDGRGQAVVHTPAEADEAYDALSPKPLVLEARVPFRREISVIVARGTDRRIMAFDPVENRHANHILDLTLAPAPVPADAAAAATRIAVRLARTLDLTGLLAVELFETADGTLLVNELAPRPHNSGHWTLDACAASQFDLHIRAVAGLPLVPPGRHSDAVMKNLIGPEGLAAWPAITAADDLIPHLYGKREARPGRKMGHVTRLYPRGGLPTDATLDLAALDARMSHP